MQICVNVSTFLPVLAFSFIYHPQYIWLFCTVFQGNTSITQCIDGQGYESYKCNPTSPHSKPTWSHHVNDSLCVRRGFLDSEKEVRIIIHFWEVAWFMQTTVTKLQKSRNPTWYWFFTVRTKEGKLCIEFGVILFLIFDTMVHLMMFYARCDCERPSFNQLTQHILWCHLNSPTI